MWTKEARIQHVPRKERYPSDMTDMEWAIIAPLIPPQRPGGRHRETDMREAMNAVRYVLRTGCQWRQLPKDFPPRSTVYNYFWEWTRYGVLDRMLEQSSKPHSLGQPVELEIVKRTDNEGGFKVVRRRWVVERTLSWLRRNRRLMAHYEAFALIAEGYAKLAMICIMLKRLAGPKLSRAT